LSRPSTLFSLRAREKDVHTRDNRGMTVERRFHFIGYSHVYQNLAFLVGRLGLWRCLRGSSFPLSRGQFWRLTDSRLKEAGRCIGGKSTAVSAKAKTFCCTATKTLELTGKEAAHVAGPESFHD
jgi:hypothetical protein